MPFLEVRNEHGHLIAQFDPDRDTMLVRDGPMWAEVELKKYRHLRESDMAPQSATSAGTVPA